MAKIEGQKTTTSICLLYCIFFKAMILPSLAFFLAMEFAMYRGADKSLARLSSLSIAFSAQGTGGSPTGPYPENRVGDQDIGSPDRPVSSGLQVPGVPFPSWSG
jgi:hypothetical protein